MSETPVGPDPETIDCRNHDNQMGAHHDRRCPMFIGRRTPEEAFAYLTDARPDLDPALAAGMVGHTLPEPEPEPEVLRTADVGAVAAAAAEAYVPFPPTEAAAAVLARDRHRLALTYEVGPAADLDGLAGLVEQARRLAVPGGARVVVRPAATSIIGTLIAASPRFVLSVEADADDVAGHNPPPVGPWPGAGILPCVVDCPGPAGHRGRAAQPPMLRDRRALPPVGRHGSPGNARFRRTVRLMSGTAEDLARARLRLREHVTQALVIEDYVHAALAQHDVAPTPEPMRVARAFLARATAPTPEPMRVGGLAEVRALIDRFGARGVHDAVLRLDDGACPAAAPPPPSPDDGPDDGHTFRFTVTSRGSYAVLGDPHRSDADHFGHEPWTLDVRAFDLSTALRRAAEAPLLAWVKPEGGGAAIQAPAEGLDGAPPPVRVVGAEVNYRRGTDVLRERLDDTDAPGYDLLGDDRTAVVRCRRTIPGYMRSFPPKACSWTAEVDVPEAASLMSQATDHTRAIDTAEVHASLIALWHTHDRNPVSHHGGITVSRETLGLDPEPDPPTQGTDP